MCLILFAYRPHTDFPLIIAANRDEFYSRPTRAPHFWDDHPQIFAGRDLQAGGTWMGLSLNGRFAAVTNVREGIPDNHYTTSRGELCGRFLGSDIPLDRYLDELADCADHYAGFNLLLGEFGDRRHPRLTYFSNRGAANGELTAGIHGLSNGQLNEPWPKVSGGKAALCERLAQPVESIQTILTDRQPAPLEQLPNTGIDPLLELQLSSCFIAMENYGTRSSTVIRLDAKGEVEWLDQSFSEEGLLTEGASHRFRLSC